MIEAKSWLCTVMTVPGKISRYLSAVSPAGTLHSEGTVADILDKGSGALVLLDGEFDQVFHHKTILFVYLFLFHHLFNVSLS